VLDAVLVGIHPLLF
jgi:hypothetical protein